MVFLSSGKPNLDTSEEVCILNTMYAGLRNKLKFREDMAYFQMCTNFSERLTSN